MLAAQTVVRACIRTGRLHTYLQVNVRGAADK